MDYKVLGKTEIKVPILGQGAWGMGGLFSSQIGISGDNNNANIEKEKKDIESLKKGIELGWTFIDTAEAYAEGRSEEIVAEAIKGKRDKVFIATKVWPNNFSHDNIIKSANQSLRRLQIDVIDLYQLHWPSKTVPIKESMKAMENLVKDGKIKHIGISNFSAEQTKEAQESLSRNEIVSNQVEYSLLNRNIEKEIMPYCENNNITIIAWSPLARGKIAEPDVANRLKVFSDKYKKTSMQIALNWLISKNNTIAIPKASRIEHLIENNGSLNWKLSNEDLRLIEKEFKID